MPLRALGAVYKILYISRRVSDSSNVKTLLEIISISNENISLIENLL